MKRLLAIMLILATLISLSVIVPGSAVEFGQLPFYMVNVMGPRYVAFPENIAEMPKAQLSAINKDDTKITITLYGTTDIPEMAKKLKEDFNSRPEGMRYLNFPMNISQQAEHMIYMDKTVALFKAWVKDFFTEYKRINGKIDGLVFATEYCSVDAYYIQSVYNNAVTIRNEMEGTTVTIPQNKDIYKNIVSDSRYATDVRPYLEERGFQFSTPTGDQSEIYPISDASSPEAGIWDAVMRNRMCKYINEACAPFMELYPGADVSNYRFSGNNQWDENTTQSGMAYTGGNTTHVGNTANENFFLGRPNEQMLDTSAGYITPITYNGAVYEDNPFHAFLSEVNTFKDMYSASKNKKISAWIAGFNYLGSAERSENSIAYTPYYTEMLFHLGMLNPQPFLGYMVAPRDTDANEDPYDYIDVMRNISEILSELTRVAGYVDRKPISVPRTWNSNFVISGMYAGGRNIWRITPNTTQGTTVEAFKVKDRVPTFTIDGETIIFPQGRILDDSKIYVTETSGYWVETPENVMPVIVSDADRYEKHPAYEENFETYGVGTTFTKSTARHKDAWTVNGKALTVQILNDNKALEMTGTSVLENTKIPANVTAGDSYAKQQVWEVTVTVPNSGELKVLSCGENDNGIRISGGKVYYDGNTELASVTAGQTYIMSREVDFRNESAFTSTYTVRNADGTVVAQQKDVAMGQVTLPVKSIAFSCTDVDKAYIDNYRLRATGVTAELRLYEADTGMRIADTSAATKEDAVYRVSWLNATGEYQVAKVYSNDKLVQTIGMPSGADSIITGLVEGNSQVTVTVEKGTAPNNPNYDEGNFDWAPEQVLPPETTAPVENEEDTTPGTEETTVPSTTETTAPTTDSTAPTVDATTPTGESTVPTVDATAPTTESTAPTVESTTPTTAPTVPTTVPTVPVTPTVPTEPVAPEKGLSGGIIALIAIASVLVLAGGGFALCWFVIKPKWLMGLELKSVWRSVLGFFKSTKEK